MKRAVLSIIALLLICPVYIMAQNTDWDKVLDRYEDICGQCITLRDRIVSGEPVSDRAVTSLLQELSQLRNTLQNASGSMTDEQKKRFAAIRDSYSGTTTSQESTAETDTNPAKTTTVKSQEHQQLIIQKTVQSPDLSGLEITTPTTSEQQIIVPSKIGTDHKITNNPLVTESTISHDFELEAYITAGYNRNLVFGGMIAVGRKPFRSGYISVLTNGSLKSADYSCLSNGNIQGGGVFWGDGSVADNALFITGGLSVWNSRSGNLSAYLGAGYGINERLWRDISGKWAIVSDLSGRGMLFQAAAAFRFTHIALSPSLIYMPSTNYLLPSIGLGYSF
jgi:hypothetical protein